MAFYITHHNSWESLKHRQTSATIISIFGKHLWNHNTNNKGADQLAHPYSSISTFVVPCLDSTESILSQSKLSWRYLVSVGEKAGLSPTWSQTPENGFSYGMAQFNSWKYCFLTIENTYYKTHFHLIYAVYLFLKKFLVFRVKYHIDWWFEGGGE